MPKSNVSTIFSDAIAGHPAMIRQLRAQLPAFEKIAEQIVRAADRSNGARWHCFINHE
jgi:hypothetical protein